MTTQTPTPAQQAEAFREEIRELFKNLHINLVAEMENTRDEQRVEIAEIRADLAQMREGLTHASQPAPASTIGDTFAAVKIEREKRKGKYYYRMLGGGGQFSKHGITIWGEVLEAMGLDKVEYGEDDIHKLNAPLIVRFSSEPYTDEEGQPKNRRKVTGRA